MSAERLEAEAVHVNDTNKLATPPSHVALPPATLALTTATLPYVLKLAQQGLVALRDDPSFGKGVNTYQGYVTSRAVPTWMNYTKALES